MKDRNYNRRSGETRRNAYQITFRTDARLSGEFASCKGLIKKYGTKKRVTMVELFASVIMPAVRAYVAPLAQKAKRERQNGGV